MEAQKEKFFDPPLWMQRRSLVSSILHDFDVSEILDVGCGEGALLEILLNSTQFSHLHGIDIDPACIELAVKSCSPAEYHRMFPREREIAISLYHGSIECIDKRFIGIQCVVALEVVEHLEAPILEAFTQNVFGVYRPKLVIVTTPNAEYNIHFPDLKYGTPDAVFRHDDHKFEWTRAEFDVWCKMIEETYGYEFVVSGVGQHIADCKEGHCTQVAVFARNDQTDVQSVEPVFDDYDLKSQISFPTISISSRSAAELVELLKNATANSICAALPLYEGTNIYFLDDLWQYYLLRESVESFKLCGSILEGFGRAVKKERMIKGEWRSLIQFYGPPRPYYEVDLS